MIIRASLRLKPYQSCLPVLRQSLSTGSHCTAKELKQVPQSSKSNNQLSTTFSEKAKDNVKTGGYGLVLVGGLGLIAVVVGTIFKELFSSSSGTNIYDRAVKVCTDHEKVQNLLGEPIKAFGEETRRGRRNRVSQAHYQDKEGRKGIKIQFYLQGLRNRAVVEVDAREDSSGSMTTRYIIVQVEDLLRNVVVVEDNRTRAPALRSWSYMRECRLSVRSVRSVVRTIFSQTGEVEPHLQADTMHTVEAFWRPRLEASLPSPGPEAGKYYVLSMFPYPSGKLHMGHVRVYSISDTFAHYYRMQGYRVIHPMGWDAFGLPAENAAIEHGVSPAVWTKDNINKMKEQLGELGCIFDWDREFATCDPEYYRWTQHLFLRMHQAGLVYQADSVVNWDPVDRTVLADEQVDSEGRSWRSGAVVERKPLKQWFLRTTNFAKSLLEGLEDPSLKNWRAVIKAQQNWIGDCSGTNVVYKVRRGDGDTEKTLMVWTDRPEHLHQAQFVMLHPEHLLSCEAANMTAVCPLTLREIPVLVADTEQAAVVFSRNCQTLLGLPGVDETHADIAAKLGLQSETVTAVPGDREEVMRQLRSLGAGGHYTSSNLRDWLISRQRYWGTPIPIVHCPHCGPVPVPADQLPVELPASGPLAECEDWVRTVCPQCGHEATRETDTMDTFVDSSWYFLRYLDPHNDTEPFSSSAVRDMPVDLYIGGMEHAYLHLYFARFFTHFLHSEGLVDCKEPFSSLITQGMVKGRSYRVKSSTKYLRPDQVYEEAGKFFTRESGAPVVTDWEKMSKSKYNGVDPGLMFSQYGCDTVRLMMLCNVGPASDRNWDEDTFPGIRNMQIKLFKLVHQAVELQKITLPEMRYDNELDDYRNKLRQERNTHLRHVNYNYSHTRNLAVVIARLNSLINAVWAVPGQVKRDALEFQQMLGEILILLAPMAPHLSSELWESFRSVERKQYTDFDWNRGVFHQEWPQVDQTFNMELKILANNHKVGKIPIVKWYFDTLTQEQAFDLACHDKKMQDHWLMHDVLGMTFRKVEGFDAELEITFDVKSLEKEEESEDKLSKEEKEKRRLEKNEARKREKLEKRAAKEERKRIYLENVARKEKITKTVAKYPKKEK